jgi:HEAT repeat protein
VLKNKELKVRWPVARALGVLGVEANPAPPEIIEALVAALKDNDARVRIHAVMALWRINRQARVVIPLLRPALEDGDTFVRVTALEILGELGGERQTLALLGEALKDRTAAVRDAAFEAAVRVGRDAVPLLTQSLAHENSRVRVAAADALGRIGPAAIDATKALGTAIEDKDARVRAAATRALWEVRPEDVADLLRLIDKLLEIEKKESETSAAVLEIKKEIEKKIRPPSDK